MLSGRRKQKSKGAGPPPQTLDLNVPAGESNAIILVGRVSERVNQLDATTENGRGSMIEILKRQKRGTSN